MEHYPFFGSEMGNRRILDVELRQYIKDTYDCLLVDGLAKVSDAGDARVGTHRVAGNMETPVFKEWVLPVGSKRGLTVESAAVPEQGVGNVAFIFSAGFGMGSPLPQPTGVFDITVNGHAAVTIRRVNHSISWRQDPCQFYFAMSRCETAAPYGSLTLSDTIKDEGQAAFGLALLVVPAAWCPAGQPVCIKIQGRSRVPTLNWFYLAAVPMAVQSGNLGPLLKMLKGDTPKAGKYNVYFGDIHTHSGQNKDLPINDNSGCGIGSWEENYNFAMGPGGMDFYALTDHEWQVEPGREDEYFSLADKYNREGRFVCLYAFEHTSLVYGHRNVYFKDKPIIVNNNRNPGGGPTLNPEDSRHPAELFAALEANKAAFFTVPHHPSAASHPFTYELFNVHDRLVEIYSCWGSSDFMGDFPRGVSERHAGLYLRDAYRKGLRFGLTAGADGHDGCPGVANGPDSKHHHQFHFLGSGRAAVLCEELTREAVFDALNARRCYATTGTPIVLNVLVNGQPMGSELPAAEEPPVIEVDVAGTNGIDYIEIVRNGDSIYTQYCHGAWKAKVEYVDRDYEKGTVGYMVKVVQVDREAAWSSPVFLG